MVMVPFQSMVELGLNLALPRALTALGAASFLEAGFAPFLAGAADVLADEAEPAAGPPDDASDLPRPFCAVRSTDVAFISCFA
jgi:hypothetical protein